MNTSLCVVVASTYAPPVNNNLDRPYYLGPNGGYIVYSVKEATIVLEQDVRGYLNKAMHNFPAFNWHISYIHIVPIGFGVEIKRIKEKKDPIHKIGKKTTTAVADKLNKGK